MVVFFALSGCADKNYAPLNVEQITFMNVGFDPAEYEVLVITPDYAMKRYDFTLYWMDNAYDYFSDSLPPVDKYTLSEEKITEVAWDSMVETLNENKFQELPEEIELVDGADFPIYYIEVVADGITYKSGGYGAGYNSDRISKRFKNISDKIFEQLEDIEPKEE